MPSRLNTIPSFITKRTSRRASMSSSGFFWTAMRSAGSPTLREEHLRAAHAVWRYARESAFHLFATPQAQGFPDLADALEKKICALIALGLSSRASLTAGSRPPADVIRALLSSTDERNAGVTALSSVSR